LITSSFFIVLPRECFFQNAKSTIAEILSPSLDKKYIDSRRAAEGLKVFNFSFFYFFSRRQGLIKIENWADDSEKRSAGTVDWTE